MANKSYDLGYTPDYLLSAPMISEKAEKKKDEKPPIYYPSVCFEGNPDFIKQVLASGEEEFEATVKIRVTSMKLTTGKTSRPYDSEKPRLDAEIISITPSLPEVKGKDGGDKPMDIDSFLKEKKAKTGEGEEVPNEGDDEE